MVFSCWQLPEMRRSIGQLASLMRTKYQGSILRFLANVMAGSNLVKKSPLNPFHFGQNVATGVANVVDLIDLSVLTFDQKYIDERKENKKHQVVDSLQEGVEEAGGHLWKGFVGMFDV